MDAIGKKETASRLGISESTLDRWAKQGRGPARRKFGGRVRYFREEVEEFWKKLFGRK
jgi:excisionase family DNA binding protein